MPVLTHRSMRGAWTGATADDGPATSRVDASQRVCVDVVKRRFAWAQAAMTSHARKRRTR